MIRNLVTLLIFLTFTACSVAPINTTTTARPLGVDKNQVIASIIVPGFQYTRGVSEKLDLTVGIESQFGLVYNVYGKYSLKDSESNGVSLAALGGAGYGDGIGKSKSAYFGGVFSYRNDSLEPFVVARLNYVSWKYSSLSSDRRDDLISIPSFKDTFVYSQVSLGGNYITERAHLALGIHAYIFPDSTGVSPFFDVGYRF